MPLMPVKGWLRDPEGDYPLFNLNHEAFKVAFAPLSPVKTTYTIPEVVPAFDQLDVGDCVANGWLGVLELLLGLEGAPIVSLSRLFLYWLCREVMKMLTQDSGTYPYLAGSRIMRIGVCSESMHPYGNTASGRLFRHPKQECYTEASDNKLLATYRIATTGEARLNALEAVIRANHPAVFGTPVGRAIQSYEKGQVLGLPADNIGGHCMVVTGVHYTPGGNRLWRWRNSWGADYGDNGYLLVDDAYMAWPELNDIWVGTRFQPLLA